MEHHGYVANLLAALEDSQDEVVQVRRRGAAAVDYGGLLAGEILRELEQEGPRSLRRLARDLSLDRGVLGHYLEALEQAGEVILRRGKRRAVLVSRQPKWAQSPVREEKTPSRAAS